MKSKPISTYYTVYEYGEKKEKRRIYTFDNAPAAHDLVECILRNDFMPTDIGVEEHEVTA